MDWHIVLGGMVTPTSGYPAADCHVVVSHRSKHLLSDPQVPTTSTVLDELCGRIPTPSKVMVPAPTQVDDLLTQLTRPTPTTQVADIHIESTTLDTDRCCLVTAEVADSLSQ
jgi:methyl coenzyme M reductase subunit C-like uncharacterized protein (methanogenesis marker protein 7)